MQKSDIHITYWLEQLGNKRPSKQQKELMGSLLTNVSVTHEIIYHNQLTSREAACLFLMAKGKKTADIAEMLSCSIKTIHSYRRSIFKKLKCTNMAQAVFEGMRHGFIGPRLISKLGYIKKS